MKQKGRAIELLERELAAKDQRIQDLLEANNAYLERARRAEDRLATIARDFGHIAALKARADAEIKGDNLRMDSGNIGGGK